MPASAEEFVPVPVDRIKPLLSGTTITTDSDLNGQQQWLFQPNGVLDGEMQLQTHVEYDGGKWWITGEGTFCFQWLNWEDGKQHCAVLTVNDSHIQRVRQQDGSPFDRIWEIWEKGSQYNQVFAAIRSSGSQQSTDQFQSAPPPMTDLPGRTVRRRTQAPQAGQSAGVATRVAPKAQQQLNPFSDIHFGVYHALVIGNNRYHHLEDLKSARNDADAVTRLLTDQYGFKVTKLTDATRSEILGTLANFRATLKPDDNLLIYYAGHGVVDNVTQRGYWLPVDAEEQNPSNWISNADLTSMLLAIRARQVMVVADSCYSGTLVRSASATLKTARDKVQWIKQILSKRGRTALVSGGLEPVTDSGGGNHSVFAKAFLSALTENRDVLEGRMLFDKIKRPVVLNSDQTPRYSDIRQAGHEGGEFVFVRRTSQ